MIACPKCNTPLPAWWVNTRRVQPCPFCGVLSRVDVYTALCREKPQASPGETILDPGEAGCFFHPGKKAVVTCAACGRFLCSLCDMELEERHLCPTCLETSAKKQDIQSLDTHRVLYDSIALSLAFLPLLFFWLTIITAPMTLYVAIRYWKAQSSITGRTKTRFVAAMVLALAQIGGWMTFLLS